MLWGFQWSKHSRGQVCIGELFRVTRTQDCLHVYPYFCSVLESEVVYVTWYFLDCYHRLYVHHITYFCMHGQMLVLHLVESNVNLFESLETLLRKFTLTGCLYLYLIFTTQCMRRKHDYHDILQVPRYAVFSDGSFYFLWKTVMVLLEAMVQDVTDLVEGFWEISDIPLLKVALSS